MINLNIHTPRQANVRILQYTCTRVHVSVMRLRSYAGLTESSVVAHVN